MKRIEWLDVMKGVAILLVVLGHVFNSMGLFSHPLNRWIHLFHMPFFFMLSGFLAINTNKRKQYENIKNKFFKLMIPFFVGGIFYSLTIGSLDDFIYNMHHCGYWFLLSLFTCWIIFLPLSSIIRSYKFFIKIIILFIPFFFGNIIMDIIPKSISDILSFPLSFSYYRFFILGYLLGIFFFSQNIKERIKRYISYNVIFMLSFIVFFGYSIIILKKYDYVSSIPTTIIQILLCCSLFFTLFHSERLINKRFFALLNILGRNSLAIYIFHFYFVYQFPIYFGNEISYGIQTLVALALTSIVLLFTLFISNFFKNNPILALLFLGKNK